MADEEKKGSVADAILDSVAGGITSLLTPPDKHGEESFFDKWVNIHSWVSGVGEYGISRGAFAIAIYIPLLIAANQLLPGYNSLLISWFFLGLPVIAPIALAMGFWSAWLWYVQSLYIFSRTNPILLEVKMPADIMKSPRAMELVLSSFWIRSGTTTQIDKKWHGGVLPYTSLEVCSFGGEIHFYIWCRKGLKNIIESAVYSQYPEVEIVEVEDYATKFEYDPMKYSCFCTDYVYDPHSGPNGDIYPIKTYVDFELDKDPKEELKVEPYASVLEVLSAFSREEQGWIQIVIRGYFDKATDDTGWHARVRKEVDTIRKEMSLQAEDDNGDVTARFPRPAWRHNEMLKSIERNMGKLIFQVGMRGIYIAPAGKMRGPEYTAFRWIWRPFNHPGWLNGLRPRRAHNDFDYLWQDWNGVRWNLWTRRYFDMYRRRQFFHTPWHIVEPPIHMSTEILATLWHPPSRTVQPPGLQRIPVSKAEAPPNLPM